MNVSMSQNVGAANPTYGFANNHAAAKGKVPSGQDKVPPGHQKVPPGHTLADKSNNGLHLGHNKIPPGIAKQMHHAHQGCGTSDVPENPAPVNINMRSTSEFTTQKVCFELNIQASFTTENSGGSGENPFAAYFKPEATANRILDFANSILEMLQGNEDDETDKIEEFLQMLIEAIEEGFNQARESLSGAPQGIQQLVDDTQNLVMAGLGHGNAEYSGGQIVSGEFSAAISYYSETTHASTSQEVSVTA